MTIGPGLASPRGNPGPAPIPPPDTSPRAITLVVNGAPLAVTVRPYDVLLDVLRERLNLTGTKRGCDMGTCGCCTVHVDGRPRLSCLTLALDCAGKAVTTIEGLRAGTELDSLQRFFAESGGSQCGFCTPGFIMTARALLDGNPDPDEGEIREAISGNVCRCTGYVKIIAAIRLAAAAERAASEPAAAGGGAKPR
jgi:aerobic-type carbon monoxide dehydrogenase small subunit (CoxS/CutS family)